MEIHWVDYISIKVICETDAEVSAYKHTFTRKIKGHRFRSGGKWDGVYRFYEKNRLPIGLWNEVYIMCKRNRFDLKIDKKFIENIKISADKEYISKFCQSVLRYQTDIKNLYPEQVDSIYYAITNRFCILNLSVGFGKSIIIYMYCMYMLYTKQTKKILIMLHNPDLVIQLYGKMVGYMGNKMVVKTMMIHGGIKSRDISDAKIVIGNIQTIRHVATDEFLLSFDAILCDEVHQSSSKSFISLYKGLINTKFRVGLSGSFKDDGTLDYYTILANNGPVVHTISEKETMDKGTGTPIDVRIIKLDWATNDEKHNLLKMKYKAKQGDIDYSQVYSYEINLIRNSKKRVDWISTFISKLEGNTIVFFIDVVNMYGKNMLSATREKNRGKLYYYIDGEVDKKTREKYKDMLMSNDNVILFATYPTFSTGIDIPTIKNIVCIESSKDFDTISQAMGRGIRLHETKDKYLWIDIVDDLCFEDFNYDFSNTNYSIKHLSERKRIYAEKEFAYTEYSIKVQ